jgi:hypothetical protein
MNSNEERRYGHSTMADLLAGDRNIHLSSSHPKHSLQSSECVFPNNVDDENQKHVVEQWNSIEQWACG